MAIYQTYNKQQRAWVKIKVTKKGSKTLDMKQKMPHKKFKGIPVYKK